ncbi:hypothetical protein K9M74_04535 [Candidatus Woesearchaeota archaeon]|nr:hypothetical protein [Candidatus Woesearchaeota archaeon]
MKKLNLNNIVRDAKLAVLGIGMLGTSCVTQQNLPSTHGDIGNLPSLDRVMEWVNPDSTDCNTCLVDAGHLVDPLKVAYITRDAEGYTSEMDSLIGQGEKALAFELSMNVDSLFNYGQSTLNKLFKDDMHKEALPRVADKVNVYDTVPTFNLQKELSAAQAKKVMQYILENDLYAGLFPSEVLSYNVDSEGQHAKIRVTGLMPSEILTPYDTTGVYADWVKNPEFGESNEVITKDSLVGKTAYEVPAKKEKVKTEKNPLEAHVGPAVSYFTNNMFGVGAAASYGPFGVQSQAFVNAPITSYDGETTKELAGEATLSPSTKILSEPYVLTTSSGDTKPVFNVQGTVDIPLAKKLALNLALGPYFVKQNTTTQTEQRNYMTATESGDALGSKPVGVPTTTNSQGLEFGGLDGDIGLSYKFDNGNSLGILGGVHNMTQFLDNTRQGKVSVVYKF